jgi:hypothetical protein
MGSNIIYAIRRAYYAHCHTLVRPQIMIANEQPMATADGYVETKVYFRKYSITIKLSLSLAAQQATPIAICPEGYSCSRAALLSFNQINDIITAGFRLCREEQESVNLLKVSSFLVSQLLLDLSDLGLQSGILGVPILVSLFLPSKCCCISVTWAYKVVCAVFRLRFRSFWLSKRSLFSLLLFSKSPSRSLRSLTCCFSEARECSEEARKSSSCRILWTSSGWWVHPKDALSPLKMFEESVS